MAAEQSYAHRVDLVLEGGGVKGIGLAGAYSVLEERGFEPYNIAGTSAGAITAALIAARYSAEELKDIVITLDFNQFEDKAWEDHIPIFDRSASILLDQGIYEGKRFYEWIKELLAAKGIHTFADLVIEDAGDDPKYRSRLQVIASDATGRQLLVLPRDARRIGIEPDELEVALAVRMSMSIPIFFEPVRMKNPETGRDHVIVDGGMLSNFPVWLFDCGEDELPEWPTFGLLLVEPSPKTPIAERLPEDRDWGVGTLISYIKSMAQTMMEAHDRLYLEKAQYARTIPIPTLGVHTTEFDITRARAEALYDSGREAAETFLETWDFDAYVAAFRAGKAVSRRRDDLVAELEQAKGAPVA
jgi:NTE family protein